MPELRVVSVLIAVRHLRDNTVHAGTEPPPPSPSSQAGLKPIIVSRFGLAGKRKDYLGSIPLRPLSFLFKSCGPLSRVDTVSCDFVPHNYETLKWLSSLPTLMQKSFSVVMTAFMLYVHGGEMASVLWDGDRMGRGRENEGSTAETAVRKRPERRRDRGPPPEQWN